MASSAEIPAGRLRSLDVFRGATIMAMILVNNAGDWGKTFSPLLHAEWHGWTFTDLVFPFFLFIVGVAMTFSFAKRLEQSGADRRPLYLQTARRTALIFALGLVLNWFPFYTVDWSTARIPGVLQRIAVVYGLASLAYLHLDRRRRISLSAALLVGYWLLLRYVPVPGYGAGDLGPDGNLAAHVDHLLLGPHVWRYAPGPGDPEGLLGTIPALVTALAGQLTGDWMRSRRSHEEKLVGLFLWGNLAIAAALMMAPWFPLNKNLWSSSYTVFTAGMALVCLAVTSYLVDFRGRDRWALPFLVFGMNSIAVYVLSSLTARILYLVKWQEASGTVISLKSWLYRELFASWMPDYWASLGWASAYVTIWLGLMGILYRKRIFIKI